MATLLGEGTLHPAEVKALVDVMTVPEMVGTIARVNEKRRGSMVAAQPPTPLVEGALSAFEADALTLVLSPDELQRTIERAGLADDGAVLSTKQQRRRASVALQHPVPAPSEHTAADSDAKVEARVVQLRQLADMSSGSGKGRAFDLSTVAEGEDEESTASATSAPSAAGAAAEGGAAEGDAEAAASGAAAASAPRDPSLVSQTSSDAWMDAFYDDEVDPLELVRMAAANRKRSVAASEASAGDESGNTAGANYQRVLPGQKGHTLYGRGGGEAEAAPLTFGGVEFSPEFLDEFMLTPGEFDQRIDDSDWAEQLLLMYNEDRAMHGMAPLEATVALDEESYGEDTLNLQRAASSESSGALDTALDEGSLAAAPAAAPKPLPPALMLSSSSAPPTLDRAFGSSKGSSVWNLWAEPSSPLAEGSSSVGGRSRASVARGSVRGSVARGSVGGVPVPMVPADVQAFLDALSPAAREHLDKLYEMGVLRKHDPVARQQRYVKAVESAEGNIKAGYQKVGKK